MRSKGWWEASQRVCRQPCLSRGSTCRTTVTNMDLSLPHILHLCRARTLLCCNQELTCRWRWDQLTISRYLGNTAPNLPALWGGSISQSTLHQVKNIPSPLDLVPAAEAVWCKCPDFPTVLQHSRAFWQGQLSSSRCNTVPAEILPWGCTEPHYRVQTLLNAKVNAFFFSGSWGKPFCTVSRQTSTSEFIFLNK